MVYNMAYWFMLTAIDHYIVSYLWVYKTLNTHFKEHTKPLLTEITRQVSSLLSPAMTTLKSRVVPRLILFLVGRVVGRPEKYPYSIRYLIIHVHTTGVTLFHLNISNHSILTTYTISIEYEDRVCNLSLKWYPMGDCLARELAVFLSGLISLIIYSVVSIADWSYIQWS